MTVASAAKRTPSEPRPVPPAPAPATRRTALRGAAVVLGLGAGVFLIARDGGFYGLAERDALAVGVWWAVALMAALGLWPAARMPLGALVAGGLLAAFAGFTALSALWAPAAETALTEADRVLLYLGVFLLAVLAARRGDAAARRRRPRRSASSPSGSWRWPAGCSPDLVGQTVAGRLLPDAAVRLSYPVDYWNGLGILIALGLPLLLRSATAIESGLWRGAAIAGVPVLSSVVFLTSSRGAAAAAPSGSLVLLALTGPAAAHAVGRRRRRRRLGRRDRGAPRARRARDGPRRCAPAAPTPGPQRGAADRAAVRGHGGACTSPARSARRCDRGCSPASGSRAGRGARLRRRGAGRARPRQARWTSSRSRPRGLLPQTSSPRRFTRVAPAQQRRLRALAVLGRRGRRVPQPAAARRRRRARYESWWAEHGSITLLHSRRALAVVCRRSASSGSSASRCWSRSPPRCWSPARSRCGVPPPGARGAIAALYRGRGRVPGRRCDRLDVGADRRRGRGDAGGRAGRGAGRARRRGRGGHRGAPPGTLPRSGSGSGSPDSPLWWRWPSRS